MEQIANWIGHLLGSVPVWLFWPLFIIVVIGAIFVYFSWEIAYADDAIPALRRRKKNGKK